MLHRPLHLGRFFKQPKQWKMGETWKVWILYRLGSLMTSARELSKYRLHLIGYKSAEIILSSMEKEKYNQLQVAVCMLPHMYPYTNHGFH